MEDIKQITQSLEKEADEKKEKIIQEAKEKAEEKKSAAHKEAEEEAEEIIEEGEREAESIVRRVLSSARTEARRKELEFKDSLSEEVFERAMERLKDLREDQEEYEETLVNLIRDGGISVGGGDLEVFILEGDNFLSEKQIEEIEKDISEQTGKDTSIELLEKLDRAFGGAVVRKSDGSLQCNNTFKARLDRMKSSLRTQVTKTLFEEEEE